MSVEQLECFITGNSGKGVITNLPSEHLELAIEERKALKYGCASLGGNMIMVPRNAITEPEMVGNLNEDINHMKVKGIYVKLVKLGKMKMNQDVIGWL